MKKVGFIGAYDKTDLVMYVAKVIRYMDKKVLVVDATLLQKMKYIVPSISPTKSYITNFAGIDFAIGFENMLEVSRYLGVTEDKIPYDYVLMDIDSGKGLEDFELIDSYKNYFVTAFDKYSLKRGLAIFDDIKEPMKLTRVLYRYELQPEDEEYLNQMSIDYKVIWRDFVVYLPNFDEDSQMIEENQKIDRIRIKRMSSGFQDGIVFIAQDILEEKNDGRIKKLIKE